MVIMKSLQIHQSRADIYCAMFVLARQAGEINADNQVDEIGN